MEGRRLFPTLLSVCCLVLWKPGGADGQLLSKGASDWYMRFHNNFMKRNIDKPVTRSFHVQSEIKHRYVVTQVKTVVHNPASKEQSYKFGFVMAKTALVSNVTLSSGSGIVVKSTVDASNWALMFMRKHDRANGNGSDAPHSNGHDGANGEHDDDDDEYEGLQHLNYLHHRADFKQFVLPINIAPMEEVTICLVYEYLLERADNKYTHVLSISPGELVEDFKIVLSIAENRPLTDVTVMAPVVGEITENSVSVTKSECSWTMTFNMSRVDQYDYFGRHGYTGDLKVRYDMKEEHDDQLMDLIVQDDFFVHFYHVPRRVAMKSIPKHVMFLLDASESMSGPKLEHAKETIEILLSSLDDSHHMNLFVFDDQVREWHPNDTISDEINVLKTTKLLEAFPCTNETLQLVVRYLSGVEASTEGTVANITNVIERAIDLDKRVWASSFVPENALTMIVLLTDGRSAAGNNSETITRKIRQLNKYVKIPIFTLGIGFDANTEFLENVAEASCGRTCTGSIIEDLDARLQWRPVQQHLNNVVFKNFSQKYIGDSFVKDSLTKHFFNVFHQGGSVAVAGQFNADDPYSQFEVEMSGQSADGYYVHRPLPIPFVTNGCRGKATICTDPNFLGKCLTLNESSKALKELEFDDKAVSINITGNCAWIAYENSNYEGNNVTLMPGEHEGLPGEIHRKVSGMRIIAQSKLDGNQRVQPSGYRSKVTSSNSVARLWAFVTIKDVLEKAADDSTTTAEIEKAYSLAMKYNFLTPFTDIYFSTVTTEYLNGDGAAKVMEPEWQIFQDNQLTYGDLSPIFYHFNDPNTAKQWESLKSCDAPIKCEGNFHFEEYVVVAAQNPEDGGRIEAENELDRANCTGSLTLFTKPDFKGESLRVEESIRQLYHNFNSQRMRSIRSEGNCCWLLMDHRFFAAGRVERFCGDKDEHLRRTNIGSIKRMNQPRGGGGGGI